MIAIHDEVMPKMGALKNHQKRLSEEIAELQGRGEAIDREEIVLRQDLVIRLDQAYEGMFVWMRQFKTHELDEMDEEESKAYLLEQKEKVEKVNMDIKSALSRAEEVRLVKEYVIPRGILPLDWHLLRRWYLPIHYKCKW